MNSDLEISKALAIAIGWPKVYEGPTVVCVSADTYDVDARPFDYREWSIIGPIAEKYNYFPWQSSNGKWYPMAYHIDDFCEGQDTPQKAIAMAVIGMKK